jgi:hypothetical protein
LLLSFKNQHQARNFKVGNQLSGFGQLHKTRNFPKMARAALRCCSVSGLTGKEIQVVQLRYSSIPMPPSLSIAEKVPLILKAPHRQHRVNRHNGFERAVFRHKPMLYDQELSTAPATATT